MGVDIGNSANPRQRLLGSNMWTPVTTRRVIERKALDLVRPSPRSPMPRSDAVTAIKALGAAVDPERLFAASLAFMTAGPEELKDSPDDLPVTMIAEHLAFLLAPVVRGCKPFPSASQVWECVNAAESLVDPKMEDREWEMGRGLPTTDADWARHHARFIRGSTYARQRAAQIQSIQGVAPFDDWFLRNAGVAPSRAVAVLRALLPAMTTRAERAFASATDHAKAEVKEWRRARRRRASPIAPTSAESADEVGNESQFRWICEHALEVLPVGSAEVGATQAEWDALVGILGVDMSTPTDIDRVEDLRSRALYRFSNDCMIILTPSHALDILFAYYDRLARRDQTLYDAYQQHKARVLEVTAREYLERVFSRQRVFSRITYKTPDQPSGEAELDLLVLWGPFAVLIEIKAGQFRLLTEDIPTRELRRDLESNLTDAVAQAARAERALLKREAFHGIDSTGTRVVCTPPGDARVFRLTVSQHDLVGVTERLADIGAGFGPAARDTLALSIGDLDAITTLCDAPEVFLHYLERRIRVQTAFKTVIAFEETDFLGAYLWHRLTEHDLRSLHKTNPDAVYLRNWEHDVDAFMERREDDAKSKKPRLRVPEPVVDVLHQLRSRIEQGEKSAARVAFSLLDLPLGGLVRIARCLEEARKSRLKAGVPRTFASCFQDTVVCLLVCDETDTLADAARFVVERERHRFQRSTGIAVALHQLAGRLELVATHVTEGRSQPTEILDARLKRCPPAWTLTKVPGRNAPCPCMSGKKFKKCCLAKIEKVCRTRDVG